MLFTMFLLGLVYLAFLAILAYEGAGMVVMLAFVSIFMLIQYFFSDKLVLMSMGAKIVSESEEPEPIDGRTHDDAEPPKAEGADQS